MMETKNEIAQLWEIYNALLNLNVRLVGEYYESFLRYLIKQFLRREIRTLNKLLLYNLIRLEFINRLDNT